MTRYVALLRGINVGGKNAIKMADLRETFELLGLKNVRTYIASGNVIFDAKDDDPDRLARKIEKALLKSLGHQGSVIVKAVSTLGKLLRTNPFKQIEPGADVLLFVTLLASEPASKPTLPLISLTDKLEVVAFKEQAVFIVARRKHTGWFGFPNNFIEKQLGVVGTTRNWSTLKKLFDVANQP